MPWQCYKVDWVHEVKPGTADVHCKRCLKACGKMEDTVDSSSSGTSSSTEDQPDVMDQDDSSERVEQDALDSVTIV